MRTVLLRMRSAIIEGVRRRNIRIDRLPASLLRDPDAMLALSLGDLVRRLPEPDELFIVQIGAFDGISGDPVHDLITKYRWTGILVEPQRQAFEQLRNTYAGQPQLLLRNVAVSDVDKTKTLYRVDDTAPEWLRQCASFSKGQLLKLHRELEGHIVEEPVACVTFETLLAEVERVDVLQIDAEGYDAELVTLFDFHRWQPRIIQFEHSHLAVSDHDRVIARVLSFGYRVAVNRYDTLAFRP